MNSGNTAEQTEGSRRGQDSNLTCSLTDGGEP
jgi:hypothetical protein